MRPEMNMFQEKEVCRGCEGCAHYRGVAWLGETMRIKCALTGENAGTGAGTSSSQAGGYADARVKDYIGCGLRRADGERQRELW